MEAGLHGASGLPVMLFLVLIFLVTARGRESVKVLHPSMGAPHAKVANSTALLVLVLVKIVLVSIFIFP